jgi:thioredoxin 1
MSLRRYPLIALVFVVAITGFALASEAIFDENADAHRAIREAIVEASRTHRNIVLDFGANWCGDCHALEAQIRKPELASLIASNFVVVNIDVGRFNKNLDLAAKYRVPLAKGIPALVVLDPHGKLLYTQDQGQFEDARSLPYDDFKAFFEKWKPKR